jgi:cytochrome c-type biogenesis protein CcmE
MAKITKKQIILLVLLFIIVVSGYFIYDLSKSTITPYITVSELIENSDTMIGRNIQIRGKVEKNSLQDVGVYFQFSIYDEEASINVFYTGSIVPGFKEENEVVLIGSLNSNGDFEAGKMILKCPSKYEEIEEKHQLIDQYNKMED